MTDRDARVADARDLLGQLGFDAERCNERSALVLLALLELPPEAPWSAASNPLRRTVEIMDWLREHYGKDYKPNTRETIRRQTLHQFVDAGLVLLNPDEPTRAINSPKNCYQVERAALDVMRLHHDGAFQQALTAYVEQRPGLVAKYARERLQDLVPVTLLDGTPVELTPGGQNVLLKAIVEQFCPRWTPGGRILYIGDAGKDDPVFEEGALAELGIALDKHGKFPDLILYLPDRNWLVLIEAASSHGPVDAKRYGELEALFGTTSLGLIYVSCFPTRAEMRRYIADIAWETEVWCADAPSHLIHFNGEKFLGPYDPSP
jgi:hypothetical protein